MKIRIIKKKVSADRRGTRKLTKKERRWFFRSVLICKSIRNRVIRGMIKNERYLEAYNLMNIDNKVKINWKIMESNLST